VILENKFSAVPLELPLTDSMENSYKRVQKVTQVLKGSFLDIYATYIAQRMSNAIVPKTIPRRIIDTMSQKFTLGFSNVPGPLKPMYYMSPEGRKIYSVG